MKKFGWRDKNRQESIKKEDWKKREKESLERDRRDKKMWKREKIKRKNNKRLLMKNKREKLEKQNGKEVGEIKWRKIRKAWWKKRKNKGIWESNIGRSVGNRGRKKK